MALMSGDRFLFSRVFTLGGGPVRPVEWALAMMEKANEAGDWDVTLWTGAFGFPGGTVAWNTFVESRAHLTDQIGKVAAHQGFLQAAEMGQDYASNPFADSLRAVVHATAPEATARPPIGAVADLVTAQPALGQIGAVRTWGVEVAELYSSITGSPVAFLADAYGPLGQVTWRTVHADPAAADAAAEARDASADYLAVIDDAGKMFLPASIIRSAMVRVG
jgi:hypothetical protein